MERGRRRLEAMERDAEDRYEDFDANDDYEGEYYDGEDNYGGLEGMDSYDEDSYEEVEYMEAGGDSMYDGYDKTSVGRIDPNDRTLTISVKNTGSADAEAIIFAANENPSQPAGVTVNVQESSHNEVKEESKSNPFKILGMKMSVSDPLQFDNVLNIASRTATGSTSGRKYQPRNATSPQNFDQRLIDDQNFEMDVTGQDSIRFMIKAGATAVFTFTLKIRANMGNLLKGQNVAELSTAPRTTGLPQLDMANAKKIAGFETQKQPQRVVKRVIRKVSPQRRPNQGPRRPLLKRRR
jgi:hypothetical protein